MQCSNCGKQVQTDSRFCQHCGCAQKAGVTPRPQEARVLGATSALSGKHSTFGRAVGIGAAILLILFLIGSFANSSDPASDKANAALNTPGDFDVAVKPSTEKPNAPTPPASAWEYSSDEDRVRGGTSFYASTTSTNSIAQSAPYDSDTRMQMSVRKSPASGTDVLLTISSGQMLCPSYQGCSGTVRFDNGPAERVSFNGPTDNSSDTIFVVGAKSFIAKLRKAKRVVIEKTLYEAGSPQFEFDVSGLKWDH